MAAVAPDDASPIADSELDGLFAPLDRFDRILIAVSGGPDSTALLHLAVRWRAARGTGPDLLAATVDHGLRPESAAEAEAVGEMAGRLGVGHLVLPWAGPKPVRGIQEAARDARYALLTAAARKAGAGAIALAHTRDDQAETVLFRLARGSGLAGLAGMRMAVERDGVTLLRPLLEVPKARLVATLARAGLPFVQDPSNLDLRFARPRLRTLGPGLAREGLDARRLAVLARRMARADAALEAATDAAEARLCHPLAEQGESEPDALEMDAAGFAALPPEIAVRLLGRAIDRIGTEGPVELAKLEALAEAVSAALTLAPAGGGAGFRRTLAGAMVSHHKGRLQVRAAPARSNRAKLAPNSHDATPGVLGKRGPRS